MKPRQSNSDCARCQQLEVRNEYLSGLIQGYDSAIAELKIEAVEAFMNDVINNQFYGKNALISFYRNYIKELNNDK